MGVPKKSLGVVVGAGVAAALIAFTAPQEGVSLKPYNDKLAHNLSTVCYGETNVEMRTYTLAECKSMLDSSMAEYAQAVKDLTPGFDTLTIGQKVADIDWTYNHGIAAYKKSTLRVKYSKKDFPGACYEFPRWAAIEVNGQRKDCSDPANNCMGLYKRAIAQRNSCLGVR